MEADLSAYHHLDYRDRWRYEEVLRPDGSKAILRKLSTRMIYVRLRHGMPPESALGIHFNEGKWPWRLTDHLLADLWFLHRQELEGRKAKDHPSRPAPAVGSEVSAERARKMRDAKRRATAEEAKRNYQRSQGG